MTPIPPERWSRIEALLDEIFELPEKDRAARLERLAAGDPELHREVGAMLAEDARTRGLLDSTVGEAAASILEERSAVPSPQIGRRIGAYRVLGELGRGGMGEVLLAEREDGAFEHRVAVKIVRGGASAAAAQRFTHERNILARLRHPNIASLHDGGTTDDGLPYFAMELVDGERINAYCDARALDVDARLALFEAVCSGVRYAHRNLVIHRDLKPSNVLVTAEGVVKLLDFGIAKLLDPDSLSDTTTQAFLTPAYAAPEQILGQPTSTATDVYALGVLLYELLAGRNPHGDTSRLRSIELARSIVEVDPPPASEIAGETVRRRLRGDLDNILERALRKNPDERYASVDDLRADIERHRRSLPVSARPATRRYRPRKFVRRNRLAVAASVGVIAALTAGVAGIAWQARVAARERDRARDEASRASAVKDYLLEVFASTDPSFESGSTLTALQLAERGAARLGSRFENDPAIRAEISQVLGKVMLSLAAYDRADTLLAEALERHRAAGRTDRVVEALVDRGEAARWRGELDDASRFLEEAVATANASLPPESPWIEKSYGSLSVLRLAQGRLEEAEEASREGIRRTRLARGPRSLPESEHLSNLGGILMQRGDHPGAEAAYRESMAMRREKGGDADALTTARILASLGDVLDDLDRLEEAEASSREALRILEREYGEAGHPELGISLSNLAGTLRRLNRLKEAESLQVRAGEVFKKHLGEEHYFVARLYSNLSLTRMKLGDLAGAERLQVDAIRIMKKQLGERHAALLGPMSNRGVVLIDLGRFDEAEAQYREALEVARESFGEENVQTTYAMLGLSAVLKRQGRLDEAQRFAEAACEVREKSVGRGHSLELSGRVALASVLRERGRRAEARELLDTAIEDAKRGLPATQEALAKAESELAALGK